jgi:NifU-like protein involved in Fe-S cluster formation
MSSVLYNRDILRLAASLRPDDRIEAPDGTAEARAPLCGSRIIADVKLNNDGKITALALRANACALGQASASILRGHGAGQTASTIDGIRQGIADCLNGTGDMPGVFPELALLAVAKDYRSRHAAILLPYDAVQDAIKNAAIVRVA